jgi:hypothetical protein
VIPVKEYKDMTEKELTYEKAKIDFFLSNKIKTDSRVDVFYQVLTDYFKRELSKDLLPLALLKAKVNKTLYRNIVSMCKEIDVWIESVLKRSVQRSDRTRVYQLVFELLGKNILASKGDISVKRLVDSRDDFPGVIEKSFPGYIESGLIDMIITAKIHKYDEEDLI